MNTRPGKRWAARRKDDGTWELVPPRPKPRLQATEAARPKPPYPGDPRTIDERTFGPV